MHLCSEPHDVMVRNPEISGLCVLFATGCWIPHSVTYTAAHYDMRY
jgi:hypothetical protein